MSEAVDSVKRRLVYIPDDEQVMLSELSGAPSHRASRMSRLLITRSPCLSEGNRTPPEPSFTSTSPSLEDLPQTTSLVMLSSSAVNCLHKVSSEKEIKQSALYEEKQREEVNNNIYKKQQTGVNDNLQSATNNEIKELDNMTGKTQVGKTRSKRYRAHIADASQHTFTPTPLPRRGATPIVDKRKVDALLLVSYDGFLLADGSGHIRPPRTAAEARKIIHALEQCKVYLTECASSASLSSLFKAVDTVEAKVEKTPLPTSIPSPEQAQEQEFEELKQEQEEEEKEEMENVCKGDDGSEENNSWNDDEFNNLSSSSTTSNSLLSSSSSSSSSSETESLSDGSSLLEEEQEELESKSSSSSHSRSTRPIKKQKIQNLSQQQQQQQPEKSKIHQAKRVDNNTSVKQHKTNKANSCNRVKTLDKSTRKHENKQVGKTKQSVNKSTDDFDCTKLPTMTAKALREMLGKHGLSTNGSKCVLRSRLKRYLKRKLTSEEHELQEEKERVQELETVKDNTTKTNASTRSSNGRSSVQSLQKSNESTPDLSISFSTSTDDHSNNRTSSLISRRSTCLPELPKATTSNTSSSVPPSSVNTTPAQSTRLELLRSSYTAPAKPNNGFWSTLMTAGSRLFSRSSNLPDNCNGKVHSQEMGRAESLPSYKRRRSA